MKIASYAADKIVVLREEGGNDCDTFLPNWNCLSKTLIFDHSINSSVYRNTRFRLQRVGGEEGRGPLRQRKISTSG